MSEQTTINREIEGSYAGDSDVLGNMLNRRCIVQDADGEFWLSAGNGTILDMSQAHIWTVNSYFNMQSWGNRHNDVLYILKEGNSAPLPVGRKCLIASVLKPALIESLRALPQHPGIRAQVLAAIKQPIPDEKVTYLDIMDWIEKNIDPKLIPKPLAPTPPAERINNNIRVAVYDRATGNCQFRGNRHGEGNYTLHEDAILDIARGCINDGDGMERFLRQVKEWLEDEVEDNYPNMNLNYSGDGLELHHIEIEDNEHTEYNYDNAVLRRIVVDILARRDRELLEELNANDQENTDGDANDEPDEE